MEVDVCFFPNVIMFRKLSLSLAFLPCFLAVSTCWGGTPAALLVGVDSEDHSYFKDILYLKETLTQRGFPENRITLFSSATDQKPTLANLTEKLDDLANSLDENDILLLVLAGPSCSFRNDFYFCPEEGNINEIGECLPIFRHLKKLYPEQIVLLLDTTLLPEKLNDVELLNVDNIKLERIPQNTLLFFNNAKNHRGYPRPEKTLCRYFAELLQDDEFNADLNDDGEIEIRELFRFFEIHPERTYFKGFWHKDFPQNGIFAESLASVDERQLIPPQPEPEPEPKVSVPKVVEKKEQRKNTDTFEKIGETELRSHGPVRSLVFDPKFETRPLLWGTSGNDTNVVAYSVRQLKELDREPFYDRITSIAICPTENILLIALQDMSIELCQIDYDSEESLLLEKIQSLDQLQQRVSEKQEAVHVAFKPSSSRFLAATARLVCVGDCGTESDFDSSISIFPLPESSASSQATAACFVLGEDQFLIASGDSKMTLRKFEPDGDEFGEVVREYSHFKITNFAVSPDSKTFVSVGADDKAVVWDILSGTRQLTFEKHEDDITSVAFSPDGRQVLSGSLDGIALLWNVETGEIVQKFDEFPKDTKAANKVSSVHSVAFSPDGKYIAVGLSNGQIVLYEK